MFAPQLKNLRVKLQERKDAFLRSDYNYCQSHLKTFYNFINSTSALVSIVKPFDNIKNDEELNRYLEKLKIGRVEDVIYPNDEFERAALVWYLIEILIDDSRELDFFQKIYGIVGSKSDYNEMLSEFKDQYFLPLYHYLDEKIDNSDLVLYLLFKYKNVVEWFRRELLFNRISQNTGKREELLDADLREFLVVEGIDFPFSTPNSPLGRADIVVNIDDKPLPMEIKLFDNELYKKNYIRKGFNQALKYTHDYSQPCGYYIIFNLSDKLLQVGSQATGEYFPSVEVNNKIIFMIVVNIFPPEKTASQEKQAEIIIIDKEYLVSEDENSL